MKKKFAGTLALLAAFSAAGVAQATVVIDGAQNTTERYLAAFGGVDTNANHSFGDSAKAERVAARNTPTHLNVFVEGSVHSGNRQFILIDTDSNGATGWAGGASGGATFGENTALAQYSSVAGGGYDLVVMVQGQAGPPADDLEIVVLAFNSDGTTNTEVYNDGVAEGLTATFTTTVRGNSGTLTAAFVPGDAANNGVEVQIPLAWLLSAPTNGGAYRVAVLNGNGFNNFWSDSTIPQNSNGGNLGFPGTSGITALAALSAPRFSWITYVDGTGDGNTDGVDSHDTINAALIAIGGGVADGTGKGEDGVPDIIEVLVPKITAHPGIYINGTTTVSGGFGQITDELTLNGNGAVIALNAGAAFGSFSGSGGPRINVELGNTSTLNINDFTFIPSNVGGTYGFTVRAFSVDEADAAAPHNGVLNMTNVVFTGSDASDDPIPVVSNALTPPPAAGTYWAADTTMLGIVAFQSSPTGANNFVYNLTNVTVANGGTGTGATGGHGISVLADAFGGTGTVNITDSTITHIGRGAATVAQLYGINGSNCIGTTINIVDVVSDFNGGGGITSSVTDTSASNFVTAWSITGQSSFSNNGFRGLNFDTSGAANTARNRVSIVGTPADPILVLNNPNRGFRCTGSAPPAQATQIQAFEHVIVSGNGVYGVELNEYDNLYPTAAGPLFSNVIFHDNGGVVGEGSNFRIQDTNAVAGGVQFEDCTFANPRLASGGNPGINFSIGSAVSDLITASFTDCIISGGASDTPRDRGIVITNGDNNVVNLTNSALVTVGAYALDPANATLGFPNGTVGGAGNTLNQTAVINRDPLYVSVDPTNAGFLDVTNPAYAGAGSAASDLAGGADYIGGAPAGDIDVSPLLVDYTDVTIGLNSDLNVTISNTGGQEVEVSSLTGLAAPFTIQSAPTTPFLVGAGDPVTVTVRFEPTGTGAASDTLTVASNDGDEPTVDVTVQGNGLAPASGDISVTPGSLTFAAIFDDETSDLTITIGNLVNVPLEVSALNFGTGTDFELVTPPSLPFTLADSSATQDITVRFNPASPGVKADTLTILSDDFADPSVVVNLDGEAYAVPVFPFIDTFDSAASASDYTLLGTTDSSATFGVAYAATPLSTGTVGEAPRTTALSGAADSGLVMQANLTASPADSINAFTNMRFRGNYFVEVDAFGYIGNPATGSTEETIIGLNHTGTRNISYGQSGAGGPGASTDGYWTSTTIDGGSTNDWTVQEGLTTGFSANSLPGLVWADDLADGAIRNNTEDYFDVELYPTGGLTALGTTLLGVAGGKWLTHRLEFVNGYLVWSVDGRVLAVYNDPDDTWTIGRVLLGHEDRFATSINTSHRTIFDNLVVDAIANDITAPNAGTVNVVSGPSGAANDPLVIEWTGFNDAESTIIRYEYTVNVNAAADSFTTTHRTNGISVTLPVAPATNDTVEVKVRAINAFDLVSAEANFVYNVPSSVGEWMILNDD